MPNPIGVQSFINESIRYQAFTSGFPGAAWQDVVNVAVGSGPTPTVIDDGIFMTLATDPTDQAAYNQQCYLSFDTTGRFPEGAVISDATIRLTVYSHNIPAQNVFTIQASAHDFGSGIPTQLDYVIGDRNGNPDVTSVGATNVYASAQSNTAVGIPVIGYDLQSFLTGAHRFILNSNQWPQTTLPPDRFVTVYSGTHFAGYPTLVLNYDVPVYSTGFTLGAVW